MVTDRGAGLMSPAGETGAVPTQTAILRYKRQDRRSGMQNGMQTAGRVLKKYVTVIYVSAYMEC